MKSLRIFKQIFPVNHSEMEIAKTLHYIGNTFFDENQNVEALNHYIESFKAKLLVLPANHPDITKAIYYIGFIFQKLEKREEALKFYNYLCF